MDAAGLSRNVGASQGDKVKRDLVVFVKPPIPGDVKTRLIPFLTAAEAAHLYKCFVIDILNNLARLGPVARVSVAYRSHPKAADLGWTGLRTPPPLFRQDGRSLGERLIHAFGVSFGRGAQQVMVMGSDAPTLPPHLITQGFRALEEADVVIGPSAAGGYCLLGLSRPCLNLFDETSWSTDQVMERAHHLAQARGYKLKVLPTHYEVNGLDDVFKLHEEIQNGGTSAPLTKRYLSEIMRTRALAGIS